MTPSRKAGRPRVYAISDLAAEFEISPRTVRFYEEKGLISPKRTKGNQRRYSRRDRARLKLILRGKRFGYTLDEIAEMIGMTDVEMGETEQIEKSLAYGERKLAEIRGRIRELELLEQDLLSVKEKLQKTLNGVKRRDARSPCAPCQEDGSKRTRGRE